MATSCSDISPATPDSDTVNWNSWERLKVGPADFANKAGRYWSSEESGYLEADVSLDAIHNNLSPVHESRLV